MSEIAKLTAEINKKYKSQIITVGTSQIYHERIPFSSPRVNYMTYGGIAIGKATEFLGAEGSGKTTLALDVVGQAQKKMLAEWENAVLQAEKRVADLKEKSDKKALVTAEAELTALQEEGPRVAVYIDAENTLDSDWARLNGVDTDTLILIRPEDQTAEQVLQIALDYIDTGRVGIIVIDSVPSLVPQQIYDEDMEKKAYAGVSGPLTVFSSKVSSKLNRNKTALVIINQLREDFQNPWNLYSTPGGRALKHLYSLRIACRKGAFIDDQNGELAQKNAQTPAGNLVDLVMVKTKMCKPDRRVSFYTIKYDAGIDVLSDTVGLAIMYNIVVQSGAWFSLVEEDTGQVIVDQTGKELKFQGKAQLLNFLRNDEVLFEEVRDRVNAQLSLQT